LFHLELWTWWYFSIFINKLSAQKGFSRTQSDTGNLTTLSNVASMMPFYTTPISIDDLNRFTAIKDQRKNPETMQKKQERRQLADVTKHVETKTKKTFLRNSAL
jgi:hypothetical protein